MEVLEFCAKIFGQMTRQVEDGDYQRMESRMQIKLVSLLVDDQDKALQFYTEKLDFKKSVDVDLEPLRWLTVVSPHGAPGVELQFEKTDFPPAKAYQKARFEADIPILGLNSVDIHADYELLKARGVTVRGEPRDMGVIWSLVFEDGCGNLVHLVQPKAQVRHESAGK